MHDVFISHSHKDKQIADAICHHFEQEKIKCWIAPRDITPGADWAVSIARAIPESKILLLIFSTHSNISKQVLREVQLAVSNNLIIIPIRIEDIQPTDGMLYYLSTVHWIDILNEKIENQINAITDTVSNILISGEKQIKERKLILEPASKSKRRMKWQWIILPTLIILTGLLLFVFKDSIFSSKADITNKTDQPVNTSVKDPSISDSDGQITNANVEERNTTPEPYYEIAMITEKAFDLDKSFVFYTWEGILDYAKENNKTYKYYEPISENTDSFNYQIDLAIQNGAKIVIAPSVQFEQALYSAQKKYPNTSFILIDGIPNDGNYQNGEPSYDIAGNCYSILFAEEQAGFLAGYAAVKDGYKNLGFIGGMKVPAVKRFGYGFIAGAEYASASMDIEGVEIKYSYIGSFEESTETQSLADSWYSTGTEVIFAAAGDAGYSVIASAENNNAKVIGVDTDQSIISETVITSAKKELSLAVNRALDNYFNGNFEGGISDTLSISDDFIGLPIENSRFKTFSKEAYLIIYNTLKLNEEGILDNIPTEETVSSAIELSSNRIEVLLYD